MNENDALEFCVQLQGKDLVGITETWWDGSHDWSVAMERYRLFRKKESQLWSFMAGIWLTAHTLNILRGADGLIFVLNTQEQN